MGGSGFNQRSSHWVIKPWNQQLDANTIPDFHWWHNHYTIQALARQYTSKQLIVMLSVNNNNNNNDNKRSSSKRSSNNNNKNNNNNNNNNNFTCAYVYVCLFI